MENIRVSTVYNGLCVNLRVSFCKILYQNKYILLLPFCTPYGQDYIPNVIHFKFPWCNKNLQRQTFSKMLIKLPYCVTTERSAGNCSGPTRQQWPLYNGEKKDKNSRRIKEFFYVQLNSHPWTEEMACDITYHPPTMQHWVPAHTAEHPFTPMHNSETQRLHMSLMTM